MSVIKVGPDDPALHLPPSQQSAQGPVPKGGEPLVPKAPPAPPVVEPPPEEGPPVEGVPEAKKPNVRKF